MLGGGVDVLFNLGADEIEIPAGPFVVYQGTHGDSGRIVPTSILPGARYREIRDLRQHGRPSQATARSVFPPARGRRTGRSCALCPTCSGKRLPFDSLMQLRKAIYAAHPHLSNLDAVTPADPAAVAALAKAGGKPKAEPFAETWGDFYLTNPIARASAVMAECSALLNRKLPLAAE